MAFVVNVPEDFFDKLDMASLKEKIENHIAYKAVEKLLKDDPKFVNKTAKHFASQMGWYTVEAKVMEILANRVVDRFLEDISKGGEK